jgi:hypothetical protein
VIYTSFAVLLELARHVARAVEVTSNACRILVGTLLAKRPFQISRRLKN